MFTIHLQTVENKMLKWHLKKGGFTVNSIKKTFFVVLLILIMFALPLAGCVGEGTPEEEPPPTNEQPIEQPDKSPGGTS
jgi:hypothetical protein